MPPREMARRWRKRIVKAREDGKEVEGYLEVRYEDLILDILYLGASRWGMVEPRETALENNKKKDK